MFCHFNFNLLYAVTVIIAAKKNDITQVRNFGLLLILLHLFTNGVNKKKIFFLFYFLFFRFRVGE